MSPIVIAVRSISVIDAVVVYVDAVEVYVDAL